MGFSGLKKIVSKIAPILGGAISNVVPGGGLAVNLISGALGLAEGSGEDEIISAISANPEAAIKLKEIEAKHSEKLIELGIEEQKIYLGDVQNARQRQIESEKFTGKRDYNLYALAWTVIAGFFVLCGVLMKWSLPEGSDEVVFMLFGALSAGFGSVLQYFFGSSKSSSDKTNLIAGKAAK